MRASNRGRRSARCSMTALAACRPMPAMPTSISSPAAIVDEIRARAHRLGFDAFGITAASARPDLRQRLEAAVAQGWYGDMDWMGETTDRRASPRALWDEARSVIMLGVNYGP